VNHDDRRALTRVVSRAIVQVRGWPGTDGYKLPRGIPPYTRRLFERNGLVVFAAAKKGSVPEEFGLGGFLIVAGASVVRMGIIVPDDCHQDVIDAIEDLAAEAWTGTTTGVSRWEIHTLSAFFDPRSGVFATTAYTGACFTIGADLGRFFGLTAEHLVPRAAPFRDSWEIWPPRWGAIHARSRVKRASPHRPPLRATARRSGWAIDFGPCEVGNGKHVGGRMWRGEFIDVLTLAYVLDADRGASFGEHRRNVGLSDVTLPLTVTVDAHGAAEVANAVGAIHEHVVVLDDRASQWFTSARDRREWRGRVDLARSVSPGSLASDLLRHAGVTAPLVKFNLTDEELARWAETYHGGITDADPRAIGLPFEAAVLDVSSCFPLVAHLIGWWRFVCAKSIRREVVTDTFVALCERAIVDPAVLMDPQVWRCCGVTIVEDIVFEGEWCLIEVEDAQRPDGRLETNDPRSIQSKVEVPWGGRFVLHPRVLVLAATLEYLVMPPDLTAQVVTRSSYGRLGLLSATAIQVHPHWHGCLTLELVNLGTLPLELTPGERVAQLVLSRVTPTDMASDVKYACPTEPEFSRVRNDPEAGILRAMSPY
jgi:deoxycytidine triphosphate deaminase